jgi:hypothetical protein
MPASLDNGCVPAKNQIPKSESPKDTPFTFQLIKLYHDVDGYVVSAARSMFCASRLMQTASNEMDQNLIRSMVDKHFVRGMHAASVLRSLNDQVAMAWYAVDRAYHVVRQHRPLLYAMCPSKQPVTDSKRATAKDDSNESTPLLTAADESFPSHPLPSRRRMTVLATDSTKSQSSFDASSNSGASAAAPSATNTAAATTTTKSKSSIWRYLIGSTSDDSDDDDSR